MADREKVIGHLNDCVEASRRENTWVFVRKDIVEDAISMLKEHDSLLGIQQNADSIMFLSTGTAKQGEERGILLGKSLMHEWIYKELIHKGLLTDEIRTVFNEAKNL